MAKDKRILFDGRFLSLSHAGIGRYSCELLKALLPLDKEQEYFLLALRGATLEADLARALNERQSPVEIIEVDAKHYSLGEQIKILRLLNRLKPDMVHFPHFNHPLLYRGKFVVTLHDLTLSNWAERGSLVKRQIYHRVISHAVTRAQKILTVSDFVKAELVRQYKLPPRRIITTYNGIDPKFKVITNPRVLKGVEKYRLKSPYILSVGQWRSHKNLLRLVEAFGEIIKEERWKGRLQLVFVGRIDPKYPQLQEKVKQLNLERAVKFTGFVSDENLPLIYNNATVFVFPSLSEGFGLPGLEAQACGTPLVASSYTSLPEIYGDGALYFNPESVGDIAEKIEMVLEDNKLRERLSRAGRENARRFSWEETARRTLEVYREILYKEHRK